MKRVDPPVARNALGARSVRPEASLDYGTRAAIRHRTRRSKRLTLTGAVRATRRARVVIAEDDAILRELLATALRLDGHEVSEARDGCELLDLLATSVMDDGCLPDLVISDLRMPGWDGMQVLAGLRSAKWSVPVFVITGYGDAQTREEVERLGATAFFQKPVDLDDLRTAVLNV
jgi:DNA-binding NtrC family response regulator